MKLAHLAWFSLAIAGRRIGRLKPGLYVSPAWAPSC